MSNGRIPTSVVLVHLGPKPIASILAPCLLQLLYSQVIEDCRIYLYVNQPESLAGTPPQLLSDARVVVVTPDVVPMSDLHRAFVDGCKLDSKWHYGYWKVCSQRFFAIYDVARHFQLQYFFHIETDVLVYRPLAEALRVLIPKNVEVALTPLHFRNVVPGFIYYRDAIAAQMVAEYFLQKMPEGKTDMPLLGEMMHEPTLQGRVYPLPVVPQNVPDVHPFFSNDQEDFGCVFDGAAIGQWLGGIDALCGGSAPLGTPHVNQDAAYRFDQAVFTMDEHKRPLVNGVPVFCLHVHSKQLSRWMSSSLDNQSRGLR